MESITGEIFYRFIISFAIAYAFELLSKWQFQSIIRNYFDVKYDGNDDVWHHWLVLYKSSIKSCYKFGVIRALGFAVFCGFFGYGGYQIESWIGLIFASSIVLWMMAELVWAKSKADKASEAVWKTLSQ